MAKISDLGIPGGSGHEREKICPGLICTIMQNFTPIGATIADISNGTEKKKQQPIGLTYGR